jgi:hypothetical protein
MGRMFKDAPTDVHDEERSGRPSVVTDDFVQSINKKFVKDGASHFQNFRVNFHKLHTIFSTGLSQLVLRKTVSENYCAQNAKNDFGFDFSTAIPKRLG